jgi:hypothetical protein
LLCYVDHHDKAYDWAERRKLETHPKTGAAQLVEIRETVQQILLPLYVQGDAPPKVPATMPLFAAVSDDELLGYGVPPEWLKDAPVLQRPRRREKGGPARGAANPERNAADDRPQAPSAGEFPRRPCQIG